jgi:hypothetical protein
MDRKSIARFRKSLDARQRELRRSVVQTQGNVDGAATNTARTRAIAQTPLWRKKCNSATNLATGRYWARLRRRSSESAMVRSGSASIAGSKSTRSASKPFLGYAIASRARNLLTARSQVEWPGLERRRERKSRRKIFRCCRENYYAEVQDDVPVVLEEPADVLTQRLCFSAGDNAPSTLDDRRRELCKPSMTSAPPCQWWNWKMNFPR